MKVILIRQLLTLAITVLLGCHCWHVQPCCGGELRSELTPQIVEVHIGFDGAFKLGYWTPVRIDLQGGNEPFGGELELVVPDGDGVSTVVASPVSLEAGQSLTVQSFVKVGRHDATLIANLVSSGQRAGVGGKRFSETRPLASHLVPLASRTWPEELIVVLGSEGNGVAKALSERSASDRQVATIADLAKLPQRRLGYDGVNWLVFTEEGAIMFNELSGDDPRVTSLHKWLENGGRLAVTLGAKAASILTPDSRVAAFIPGSFAGMVDLDRTRALEQYAETDTTIGGRRGRVRLAVPRLKNVRGKIEAYAGSRHENLPLVVRASQGFGEIVFAAVDFDQVPISDWSGKSLFLDVLLQLEPPGLNDNENGSRLLATSGYNDLTGALRYQLSRSFEGISTVSFTGVTLLVLAYLALIGPIDYFLVKKILPRMEWTWVTFPAIILLTSGGAYWFATQQKGSTTRVNQAELIDFDLVNNRARGFVWASLYSPQATTYDLSLAVAWPNGEPIADAQPQIAWLGLPGTGLGGMQSAGDTSMSNRASSDKLSTASKGYWFSEDLSRLNKLPIQIWSTKVLAATWDAPAPEVLTAALTATGDGLAEGTIVNKSGTDLEDAFLLYGTWAWRLGDLGNGKRVVVDERRATIKVKTLLTNRVRKRLAGQPTDNQSASGRANVFVPNKASVGQLLDLKMFYKAAGARQLAQLENDYQSECDLTHLLDHGHAILIARSNGPRSELLRNAQPLRGDQDRSWTVYRFVIPVDPYREDASKTTFSSSLQSSLLDIHTSQPLTPDSRL